MLELNYILPAQNIDNTYVADTSVTPHFFEADSNETYLYTTIPITNIQLFLSLIYSLLPNKLTM